MYEEQESDMSKTRMQTGMLVDEEDRYYQGTIQKKNR